MAPRVEIEYCTQCRWLLRAAWMAQELLTTFGTTLGEVALVPGRGGIFDVRVNGQGCVFAQGTGTVPGSEGAEAACAGLEMRSQILLIGPSICRGLIGLRWIVKRQRPIRNSNGITWIGNAGVATLYLGGHER